jgi:PAS domain S-box-containing protein
MSPILALCFMLISLNFLSLTSQKINSEIAILICNNTIFITTFLLCISLSGYIFGISSFYAWGYFSPIAIHSALAVLCISISMKLFINNQYERDNKSSFNWAYLVTIVFLIVWMQSVNQESRAIKTHIKNEISVIENNANQALNSLLKQLSNIQTDKNNAPINPVNPIYKTPWIKHIQWFDLNTANQTYALPNIDINNNFSDKLLKLFKEVEETKVFAADTLMSENAQYAALIVILPSFLENDKLKGFVVTHIDIKTFINSIQSKNHDVIALKSSHNYQDLFDNTLSTNINNNQFTQSHVMSIHGMTWEMELTPSLSFFNNITSSLPAWLLFMAVMFSYFYTTFVYFFQLSQDKVIQLKKINDQLNDEKNKLNTLTDNLNDAVIIINNKGIIQSFSQQAETLFGYKQKEIIGRSVNVLMPTELSLEHDSHIKGFNAKKKPLVIKKRSSLEGLHKNQNKFPIDITLAEITIAGEQLFIGVIKNIYFENRTIEELDKAKYETESIKIARSKFIEYMGHEIKSPMNSIYGVLQILNHEASSEKSNKLIEQALFSSKSLIYTMDDIIDFSKIEGDKLFIEESVFSIKQLLHTLIYDMTHEAQQKDVKLSVSYSSNFSDGWLGDPVRIRQIILNLILNSLKFTVDGSIDIHIDIIDSDTNRKSIKITVSDTGSGMSKDKAANLFNHIDQGIKLTTHLCDGSGIDLLIVEKMVQLMDGSISVGSTEGEGSCFLVILPLIKQDKNFQEMHLHTQEVVPHFDNKHILLVEHDAVSKVILKSMLEATKANISVVSTAEETLNYLKEKQTDVIMMNTQLPILNGIEACKEIRNKDFIMPIIAVAEHKIQDDIKDYEKLGFNARIDKPIELHVLYQILTEQLS